MLFGITVASIALGIMAVLAVIGNLLDKNADGPDTPGDGPK
jgi:hypothetical protein